MIQRVICGTRLVSVFFLNKRKPRAIFSRFLFFLSLLGSGQSHARGHCAGPLSGADIQITRAWWPQCQVICTYIYIHTLKTHSGTYISFSIHNIKPRRTYESYIHTYIECHRNLSKNGWLRDRASHLNGLGRNYPKIIQPFSMADITNFLALAHCLDAASYRRFNRQAFPVDNSLPPYLLLFLSLNPFFFLSLMFFLEGKKKRDAAASAVHCHFISRQREREREKERNRENTKKRYR